MYLCSLFLGIIPFASSLLISPTGTRLPAGLPTLNAKQCSDVSKEIEPSCWDLLGMQEWMSKWNSTTKTCKRDEIWSTCFLRLAFGQEGFDCSVLGSLDCEAPEPGQTPKEAHAFYGSYNIWAVEQYFLAWEEAIYATASQPAINNLVSLMKINDAPPVTMESLLAAIVRDYGAANTTDDSFIKILQTIEPSTPLDLSQEFMSTQLAGLLGDLLASLSTNYTSGTFLQMAQHGQMITQNATVLQSDLKANLADVVPNDTN